MQTYSTNFYNPMMQNPYMDRLTQLQGMQQMYQAQIPASAIGRIVENIETVKAMDIPMDGNTYYFPKADGKEIFSKRWLPNGTTEIRLYKPFIENTDISTTNTEKSNTDDFRTVLDGIKNDIQILAEKIDNLNKEDANDAKPDATDAIQKKSTSIF